MRDLSAEERRGWLTWFYRGLLVLGVFILLGRLIELQIIKGEYYRDLAESNRIRRVSIMAPRGRILARGGEELVGNREIKKTVLFDPVEGYEKVLATPDTPIDEVLVEWERVYKLGEAFSHVSGYLSEVNGDEVNRINAECQEKGVFELSELVGRGGIEQYYDCVLRGVSGEEMVEVDSTGKRIRTFGRRNAVSGEDLQTTIDAGLQRKIYEVMEGVPGAVIATDGRGEVLAFYSSPSFDPTDISSYLEDDDLPLFNRVIGGAYPPGSVYKLVTAAAALEEGKINKDYRYVDTGSIKIGDFEYTSWYLTQYGKVEGEIDLVRAIARSTDTFFYKAGELVGIDALVDWSRRFGLGEKTGIDLPGEVGGLLPNPSWKKAVKGERWYLGNTYHMSIGQGDLTTTPLQVNVWTSVFANGGELCRPYIVDSKVEEECHDLGLSEETLKLVTAGMVATCSPGGTAYPFFDFFEEVACKTGTAEISEDGETHAWFTVFAPANHPEIVLTVLVEEGGEGSKVAAPLAREIMDYWFER